MDTADPIRAHTPPEINSRIDLGIATRVRNYEHRSHADITRRIEALDREWDVDRLVAVKASALAFTGLALGTLRHRSWLAIPALTLPLLLQYSVQGWCPPIALLRRLGVRTRGEIDREKYALKVLRGDFETTGLMPRADAAILAVNR
jgi:hypothetical protein